jgi:nucleoside-diphosphate-sugar epimerase
MRRLLKAGSRPAPWRAAPVRESPCALSAEVAVGDVTRPEKLALALEGCAGVLSALSASTDRQAGEVEYGGNVNLLSAAREAGMQPFVYSSALLVDHPLARRVRTFREKTRFEEVLLGADDVSADRFASCVVMETLLMALSGPVAFVPGRQPCPVRWISAGDVDLAAVRHSRAT